MAQPINNLFLPIHDDIYFTDGVIHQLEMHLHLLRHDVEVRDIEENIRHKYHGDFYGLLTHYSIPQHLHRITARVNDMESSMAYRETMSYFYLPRQNTIDKIIERYKLSIRN